MKASRIWSACGIAAVVAAGLVSLCACEWGAGSDATSWSDSFNWVNFSGAYRSNGTEVLTSTGTSIDGRSSTSDSISTSGSSSSADSYNESDKTKASTDINIPTTIKTTVTPVQDKDGQIVGTITTQEELVALNGTFSTNGASSRDFSTNGTSRLSSDNGTNLSNRVRGNASTNTSVATSIEYTGKQVYTVVQQGQNLTITHGKSGQIFTGKFTSIRSASGFENTPAASSATQGRSASYQSAAIATDGQQGVRTTDGHAMPPDGDTIIGSFEAKGDGGRMVGTFQGTVSGGTFVNRTMTATLVGPTRTTQIDAACMANTTITVVPNTDNSTVTQ